jgi:hypothetical protein
VEQAQTCQELFEKITICEEIPCHQSLSRYEIEVVYTLRNRNNGTRLVTFAGSCNFSKHFIWVICMHILLVSQ